MAAEDLLYMRRGAEVVDLSKWSLRWRLTHNKQREENYLS